jgi:hypothetical protein
MDPLPLPASNNYANVARKGQVYKAKKKSIKPKAEASQSSKVKAEPIQSPGVESPERMTVTVEESEDIVMAESSDSKSDELSASRPKPSHTKRQSMERRTTSSSRPRRSPGRGSSSNARRISRRGE